MEKLTNYEKEILAQLVMNEIRDDERIAPEKTLRNIYGKLKKVI